ncbi:unnamed protein product [Protopolystoma xenopodis]|uniref:Uncharacterized protein n=1 Tax=Protopolystoma xenopodis TaxID=117903 RepID=A0A3S5AJV4_9PLAT|nr:unnamed protein product [Protopolystoma xenopodis]
MALIGGVLPDTLLNYIIWAFETNQRNKLWSRSCRLVNSALQGVENGEEKALQDSGQWTMEVRAWEVALEAESGAKASLGAGLKQQWRWPGPVASGNQAFSNG